MLSSLTVGSDGFHSSSSDPALQQKYGHVKETVNVAPPPIAPAGSASYSLFSTSVSTQQQQSVHSRYVGFDPHSAGSYALPPPPVYPPATAPVAHTGVVQGGAVNVNVFNPATDLDVVSLSADSSALL